ncbi:MAG: glycosyltransferase 61 family protein [Burkholderiales bacterium]
MRFLSNLFVFLGASKGPLQPSSVDEIGRERAARVEAEAALARLDLPAALASLQEWEKHASEPLTLALLGHVLKTMGKPDRALDVLEGGLRTHRDDIVLLETLASLYEYTQDAALEYRCRKRRMMLSGCEIGHVTGAMKALLGIKSRDGLPAADIRLIRALFKQREAMAQPEECVRFAELLFKVEGAQNDAIELMTRHQPAPPGMQDRTFKRASVASVPPKSGVLRKSGSGEQAVQLLNLTQARVLSGLHWAPCLPDANFLLDVFMTVKPVYARERASSPMLLLSASQAHLRLNMTAPQVVEGPCVLLGGGAATNYYHFLHEHLSRLAVLDEFGVNHSQMRYVVGQGLQPFQREYLDLLGIREDQLVEMPDAGVLEFATLLAPVPLGRGGNFTSSLIATWARSRLVSACRAVPGGRRKLFLSRAGTTRRRIVNEAELFGVFEAYGYEFISPEELSVRDQIILFSQATHIAGSGGAALTNMLFMPPGGQVLMLNNRYIPSHARNLYFEPMSRACGHSFTILSGEPVSFPTSRAIDADVRIDLDATRALLEKSQEQVR